MRTPKVHMNNLCWGCSALCGDIKTSSHIYEGADIRKVENGDVKGTTCKKCLRTWFQGCSPKKIKRDLGRYPI